MSERPNNKNTRVKRVLIYLLVSIPMAFILVKVIKDKNEIAFWIFFAILGISTLLFDEFKDYEEKTKFYKIVSHILYIATMTLFLSWGIGYYIFK